MGKRLNKAMAKAQAQQEAYYAWMESRYDRYGANDPLLMQGVNGYQLTDQQQRDLAQDGYYGRAFAGVGAIAARGHKGQYEQELSEWSQRKEEFDRRESRKALRGYGYEGSGDYYEPKQFAETAPVDPSKFTVDKYGYATGGLSKVGGDYRAFVYGADAQYLKADEIESYMVGKKKEYETDMAAKKEYEDWEKGQEAKKVAERVRGEEYERRKTMFGRNSTYRTGVIGITQKANTQQKKLMGA